MGELQKVIARERAKREKQVADRARKQTLEEALKEDRMLRDIDDSIKAWKAIGKKEPLTETDDSGDTRDYLIVAVITIVILAVIAFIALAGGVQLV